MNSTAEPTPAEKPANPKPPNSKSIRPRYTTFTTIDRPVPHSSFYRVGGTGENPYMKLFLQVGAWISIAVLLFTIACGVPGFHHTGTRWNAFLITVSLTVIGAHSAYRKVWPAAIVVWLVALSAFLAMVGS